MVAAVRFEAAEEVTKVHKPIFGALLAKAGFQAKDGLTRQRLERILEEERMLQQAARSGSEQLTKMHYQPPTKAEVERAAAKLEPLTYQLAGPNARRFNLELGSNGPEQLHGYGTTEAPDPQDHSVGMLAYHVPESSMNVVMLAHTDWHSGWGRYASANALNFGMLAGNHLSGREKPEDIAQYIGESVRLHMEHLRPGTPLSIGVAVHDAAARVLAVFASGKLVHASVSEALSGKTDQLENDAPHRIPRRGTDAHLTFVAGESVRFLDDRVVGQILEATDYQVKQVALAITEDTNPELLFGMRSAMSRAALVIQI